MVVIIEVSVKQRVIQLFQERLSGKSINLHATILKGSLGHNKYSFRWHIELTILRSYDKVL